MNATPDMSLAALISKEFDVPLDQVMLLRHSNQSVGKLLTAGATIEDYTFTQPTDSRYDYARSGHVPIRIVVVIVQDHIYGAYRVLGVESEGTTYSLTSNAHRQFDIDRGKPPRPAKRFKMARLQSSFIGSPVSGWEGRSRTAVQRLGGSFFMEVKVLADNRVLDLVSIQKQLNDEIDDALSRSPEKRRERLILAPKIPRKLIARTTAFIRNADVIAEVLVRAEGRCEICSSPAPFTKRKDGSPYLEVHHKVRLADGGEDTIENAIAVCPNCHRREHYA